MLTSSYQLSYSKLFILSEIWLSKVWNFRFSLKDLISCFYESLLQLQGWITAFHCETSIHRAIVVNLECCGSKLNSFLLSLWRFVEASRGRRRIQHLQWSNLKEPQSNSFQAVVQIICSNLHLSFKTWFQKELKVFLCHLFIQDMVARWCSRQDRFDCIYVGQAIAF